MNKCSCDTCSCEPWNLVCVPTKKNKREYLSHVTCFSATGSTVYISLFPVSACLLLVMSIVFLLRFSFLNHLINHITVPVKVWSSLHVYVTTIKQKWIALVFFLFGYFFYLLQVREHTEAAFHFLVCHVTYNMKYKADNLHGLVYPLLDISSISWLQEKENAKRPVIIGKIGGEENKKSISYSSDGEPRQNSNSFQQTQRI